MYLFTSPSTGASLWILNKIKNMKLNAKLQDALKEVHQEDPVLEILASEILEDLNKYLKGAKGFLLKRMIKMVQSRFDRDEIDDEAFAYITAKLLHEFHALDELYEIFDGVLAGEKRRKADQIVTDMRAVLNGKIVRAFKSYITPDKFAKNFEAKMVASGIETEKAAKVAQILWEEVQKEFGV